MHTGRRDLSALFNICRYVAPLRCMLDDPMEERRRFPRTEINEPAFVSTGGSVMHCTVLNISAEGCAIEVNEPAFVPQRFRLVMANDSSLVRECQVVWIQQNRIGLSFVEATQSTPRSGAGVALADC